MSLTAGSRDVCAKTLTDSRRGESYRLIVAETLWAHLLSHFVCAPPRVQRCMTILMMGSENLDLTPPKIPPLSVQASIQSPSY